MISDNIRGSVIKFCQSLILDLNGMGITGFQFTDWDAHANMQEIPDFDLLGPTALAWSEQEGICEISFAVGVSTLNDTNLFRSWKAIGHAFEMLRPAKPIPFYNATTTSIVNQMIVMDGTMVSPMSRAEVRPFQFVQASLLLEIDAALV